MTGNPVITCASSEIGFDRRTGYPTLLEFPTEKIASRWTTTAEFDATTVVFMVRSDDGIRVYVDGGDPVIDEWETQSAKVDITAQIVLAAGEHTIVVEHFNGAGEMELQVDWQQILPTASATPVPAPAAPSPTPTADSAATEPDISTWNPQNLGINCLGKECFFLFSNSFQSEAYSHKIEFADLNGTTVAILSSGSTFNNYVQIIMTRKLPVGTFMWRVNLYLGTESGDVFVKASAWSDELYSQK